MLILVLAKIVDNLVTHLAEFGESGVRPTEKAPTSWLRIPAAAVWGVASLALRAVSIFTVLARQAAQAADDFFRVLAEELREVVVRHVELLFPIGIPEQLGRNSARRPGSSGHGHVRIVIGDPGEDLAGERVDGYARLIVLVGIGSGGVGVLIGVGHVAWLVPRTWASRGYLCRAKDPGSC